MFNDANTVTDVVSADPAPNHANVIDEIADNGSMTTQLFIAEQAAVDIPTDTGEEAARPEAINEDSATEDTLTEPPQEIEEVLHTGHDTGVTTAGVAEETLDAASVPEEEATVPIGPPRVTVCSQTNGRTNNEDSYFIQTIPSAVGTPSILLLALSDGMGGHDFGEHASRETLRKLALLLFEQYAVMPRLNSGGVPLDAEEIGHAMVQAIPLVSGHVQRIAEINGWNRSGATLVAGAIVGDTAVFVNVGDSPAFHVRHRRNYVAHLTDDHSLAGMLLKANLITAEMAKVHEGRCQLEHYIGGPNLPNDIPIRMVTLKPGDYLLLCSDGVSNSLTDDIILQLLAEEGNLSDRAVGFVVHARQEGEHDNQTIVLYRHGDSVGQPELTVVPDAGPNANPPSDFPDNIPAQNALVEAQA
jgi:protein phosphatase